MPITGIISKLWKGRSAYLKAFPLKKCRNW